MPYLASKKLAQHKAGWSVMKEGRELCKLQLVDYDAENIWVFRVVDKRCCDDLLQVILESPIRDIDSTVFYRSLTEDVMVPDGMFVGGFEPPDQCTFRDMR